MWINTTTMQVFTLHHEIRASFTDVSLPSNLSDAALANLGILPVTLTTPTFNPLTQIAREILPTNIDGVWVQQWEIFNLDIETIAVNQATKANLDREAAKAARAAAVEAITVTTAAGHTFDGDEASQARMSRAILVLSTGAAASVPWVLADNTVIQATAAELTEALALAGAEQARLWVLP